jgi:hypothetical protein
VQPLGAASAYSLVGMLVESGYVASSEQLAAAEARNLIGCGI